MMESRWDCSAHDAIRFAAPSNHGHAGEPLPIWHPPVTPQSLSAVYIHLVFSTKDHRPFLRDKPTRDALHAYLGGVSKQLDCPPLLIGGVEDHVHLLARFGRTITQAEWVKELKRVSNLWPELARKFRGMLFSGKRLYCQSPLAE